MFKIYNQNGYPDSPDPKSRFFQDFPGFSIGFRLSLTMQIRRDVEEEQKIGWKWRGVSRPPTPTHSELASGFLINWSFYRRVHLNNHSLIRLTLRLPLLLLKDPRLEATLPSSPRTCRSVPLPARPSLLPPLGLLTHLLALSQEGGREGWVGEEV